MALLEIMKSILKTSTRSGCQDTAHPHKKKVSLDPKCFVKMQLALDRELRKVKGSVNALVPYALLKPSRPFFRTRIMLLKTRDKFENTWNRLIRIDPNILSTEAFSSAYWYPLAHAIYYSFVPSYEIPPSPLYFTGMCKRRTSTS